MYFIDTELFYILKSVNCIEELVSMLYCIYGQRTCNVLHALKRRLCGRIGFWIEIYKTLYTPGRGMGDTAPSPLSMLREGDRPGVQGFVDFDPKPYSSYLPKRQSKGKCLRNMAVLMFLIESDQITLHFYHLTLKVLRNLTFKFFNLRIRSANNHYVQYFRVFFVVVELKLLIVISGKKCQSYDNFKCP